MIIAWSSPMNDEPPVAWGIQEWGSRSVLKCS